MKYKKGNKGFTFIELLVIILILSLVVISVILIMRLSVDDVNDKIDKITEWNILDAARAYTLEYRGSANWNEEEKENGTSFCISLDSLVNSGYFKTEESNYDKFRNKYAVSCDVVNGVFNYKFVELNKVLEDDNICKYAKRDSWLIEKDETTNEYVVVNKITKNATIIDDDVELGNFSYEIVKNKNFKYALDLDLNVKIKELIDHNSNIYVNFLLDESGSMNDNDGFKNATGAISDFSSQLADAGVNFAFIGFGGYPVLRRDYDKVALTESDFMIGRAAWATNAMAGIDLATSLIYNAKYNPDNNVKMNENSKIYTIMFTDGYPYEWSWLKKNESELSVGEMSDYGNNYNFEDNLSAQTYYSVYKEANAGCYEANRNPPTNATGTTLYGKTLSCNNGVSDYSVFFKDSSSKHTTKEAETAWKNVEYSSGFLKSLGSKLVIIAYLEDFSTKSTLKRVVSNETDLDDNQKFCNDSAIDNYCYYNSFDEESIKKLFENFASNIEKIALVDKVKLSLESFVDDNNVALVKVYDSNGNEISNLDVIDLSEDNLEDAMLNISDRFDFVINEDADLYDDNELECDEYGKVCVYEGTMQFLNIRLGLHYVNDPDDEWNYVDIMQPEFNFKLSKINTMN